MANKTLRSRVVELSEEELDSAAGEYEPDWPCAQPETLELSTINSDNNVAETLDQIEVGHEDRVPNPADTFRPPSQATNTNEIKSGGKTDLQSMLQSFFSNMSEKIEKSQQETSAQTQNLSDQLTKTT